MKSQFIAIAIAIIAKAFPGPQPQYVCGQLVQSASCFNMRYDAYCNDCAVPICISLACAHTLQSSRHNKRSSRRTSLCTRRNLLEFINFDSDVHQYTKYSGKAPFCWCLLLIECSYYHTFNLLWIFAKQVFKHALPVRDAYPLVGTFNAKKVPEQAPYLNIVNVH